MKSEIDLIIRDVIRTGQIVGTGDSIQIVGPDRTIETAFSEETLEGMADKIIEEVIEMIDVMITTEAGIDQEERIFTRNYSSGRDRSSSNSRSRSGSRASTNRDRIRCYKCREYDYFTRDCPNSREERDLEQLQQMLNMEEQTHRLESPEENYRTPLNL